MLGADEQAATNVRIVAPVTVAMMLRAAIVVGHVGIDVDEFLPTLALLMSEVALALQAMDSAEQRHRVRTEPLLSAVIRRSPL